MNEHDLPLHELDVDTAWLVEWAADGVAAIEVHLAKHAAFADFMRTRPDVESEGHGDRRQDA